MPDEIYGVMAVKNGQKQTIMNLSNARQKSYADLQNMTDAQKKGVIVCPDYPKEEFLVTADEVSYGSGTVKDALDEAQIVKLTGTMTTYNGVITVSFPTGFDVDNTVVLSAEIEMSGLWSNMYNGNLGVQTAVHSGGINVYTRVADFAGHSFRIFIRRT